jgi:hypothetical protein
VLPEEFPASVHVDDAEKGWQDRIAAGHCRALVRLLKDAQ